MSKAMKTEPLWTVAGVTALVVSGIGAASTFGFALTDVQESAVLAFSAVLAPLVVAGVARSKVWAPQSVDYLVEERTSSAIAGLGAPELDDDLGEGLEDDDEDSDE